MSPFNLTLPIQDFEEARLSRPSAFVLWLTLSAGGWSLILRLI